MHFLCFLVLCFSTTIPIPVHTTVIITGNLKDFRSFVKTLSLNSAKHIEEAVGENDSKFNEGTYKDDEQTDKTVEQNEDQQYQQYDSTEVITEFLNDIVQKPVSRYLITNAPKVVPIRIPTVLAIDDIVEQVKQKLLQEILSKSGDARKLNAQANTLLRTAQEEQTQLPNPITHKEVTNKSSENAVDNIQQTPVPMKVVKEEIQFEATYEDGQDKDVDLQTQNLGQIRSPEQGKVQENGTKNVLPNKNKTVKKVRFVKQIVVPANVNLEQPANVLQPNMNQPTMQQPNSGLQLSMVEQPNLVRQLTLMQHQIDQINKTALQNMSIKKSSHRQTQQTDAEDANSEPEKAEEKKTFDSNEDDAIQEETAEDEEGKDPTDDNPSSKEQLAATIEEGQLSEEAEEPTATIEEEDGTKDTTPGEMESFSNEEVNKADKETLRSKVEKEELDIKIHTKDFGNTIVELGQKSESLNEPALETGLEQVNSNLTWDNPHTGARKVMLF